MIFWRNFLFTSFLIIAAIGLTITIIIFSFSNFWFKIAADVTPFSEEILINSVMNSIVIIRSFAIFFFLSPALALHIMIKRKK